MRCNNCGWDNDPGSSNCVKCGHSLSGGNAASGNPYQGVNVPNNAQNDAGHAPRPTVVGTDAIRKEMQEQPLRATVMSPGYGSGASGTETRAPRPTVMSPGYGGGAPAADTHAPRPTVMSPGYGGGNPPAEPRAPRPTVKITDLGKMPAEETPAMSGQSQPVCPQCGYILTDNYSSCPSCGAMLSSGAHSPAYEEPASPKSTAKEKVICPKCHSEVSSNFAFCPMCGERLIQEQPEVKGPQCSLTIIPDEDEDDVAMTNNYVGEKIVLNRDNTEPTNRTITSKEQAVLICEDGKWYIENRSEQCSTYLEANRRLEIFPGDIVMLGDRRFKFKVEG